MAPKEHIDALQEALINQVMPWLRKLSSRILDIDKNLFKEVGTGRSFVIVMKSSRSDIRKIHTTYSEVTVGEPVALFNHLGLLEIAINRGAPDKGNVGASGLLGIQQDDVIRIEFAR